MSSITHELGDQISMEHSELGIREFSRLEKMLLFAVVSECERCVRSEGEDCLASGRKMGCPFVSVREEFQIYDVMDWKELIR
jgi:hypothetical protein